MANDAQTRIRRELTALRRVRCSRPVALAMAEGLITEQTSVLDYGCGHGGDVRFLAARGISAVGWDPHFSPDQPIAPADVVNLGYVLNVIEDARERSGTLERAFSLAKSVLVVSVRVDNTLEAAEECGDGLLTVKGTFQKIYTQDEFRSYIERTLRRRVHTAALGIGYVFPSDAAERQFVAAKAFTRRLEYRPDLIASFEEDEVAKRYVCLANELGRVPRPDEFDGYPQLLSCFGSEQRISRLLLARVDASAYAGSRAERRSDMLVFLAMLKLQGIAPPPYRALPAAIQADVKVIWGSYERALKDGTEFLFALGKPDAVRVACAASTIGKLLPADLYVHRSAEDELPALLRVVLFAAKKVVGDVAYDVAKIALDGRAVAFLTYPGFEDIAHPALARSVRVYLPKASYGVRDYSSYANPPILHRKETLVSREHPRYGEFSALTGEEERLGLLGGGEIGFRSGWDALLSARRLVVEGHTVHARDDVSPVG